MTTLKPQRFVRKRNDLRTNFAKKRGTATRSAAIPARWKWHYKALTVLRDRLIDDCGERLKDAAELSAPPSMDAAASAADDVIHARALSQLAAEHEALSEVDAALRRIEAGTYGVCEASGRAISSARLRALPWTRYCKAARLELERDATRHS
jgi:RNA polymerase-binding transcription factor DksA